MSWPGDLITIPMIARHQISLCKIPSDDNVTSRGSLDYLIGC